MLMAPVKQPSERVFISRDGEVINVDRAWQKSDARIALSRREQALLAAAGLDGPEARWYVLRIDNGADKAVDSALKAANVECWMPVIERAQPRRGGRAGKPPATVMAPALPGYMFVRVVSTHRTWAGLSTIKGIAGVLGSAFSPASVSDEKVLKLKHDIEHDPKARVVLVNGLKPGDKVVIDDGPFRGFEAEVDTLIEAGPVGVEVFLFGRPCHVTLDLAQLTKIG